MSGEAYRLDPHVESLVTGKRICIVGRGMHLLEDPEFPDQGKVIDSYDVVVRVNHPLPHTISPLHPYSRMDWDPHFIPKQFQEHLGTRCEILFMYLRALDGIFPNDEAVDKWIAANGQILLHSRYYPKAFDKKPYLRDHPNLYISEFKLPRAMRRELGTRIGNPFTGTYAVAYLSMYNVQAIRAIGYTCRTKQWEVEQIDFSNKAYGQSAHRGDKDLKWLCELEQQDKRITLGSPMWDQYEKLYVESVS